MADDDIEFRLLERARIRRQIPNRKSAQEGKPDRIADLLEEAAGEIKRLRALLARFESLAASDAVWGASE